MIEMDMTFSLTRDLALIYYSIDLLNSRLTLNPQRSRQCPFPIEYKGKSADSALDLIVNFQVKVDFQRASYLVFRHSVKARMDAGLDKHSEDSAVPAAHFPLEFSV
ncbi:MAG TPA: hypothetical protein ENI68_07665 [Gammaproteobacteria bacterium]|nr:hypothetical protein [Gammaproteobacteria bacterium]